MPPQKASEYTSGSDSRIGSEPEVYSELAMKAIAMIFMAGWM